MAKSRKSDTVETPTVNVEVASTKKATPAKAAKAAAPAKTKATKATKPIEVVPTTEVVAVEADAPDNIIAETFSEFMAKFQTLVSQMNSLKTEFRALEKKAIREIKAAQKASSKRKRKGNRSPSGFVKPTLISNELANFLKKPIGTEMARTEVTREINGYIRANNLQDKQNGRKINPDSSLATLLKIGNNEELTYFNLQRYMSPHFAKANAKPTAEAK
jgi:chromatin remodeling complex protein RSC6